MPEIPKGFYIKKNGKWVRRITLAQVQIEFQKKPFQKTPKDIETIKKLLVEYAEMNLLSKERRKMIACVKKVKTKKDLKEAIELAEKYAEQHYKRTLGKKKQNKKTTPPEPRSKKEIEEQISGIMKHPAFEFFADDKKFKEICVGDVERPTEFDEFIVQESDNAEIVVKSQIALLAKESDYITMQLERWKNEKIKEGDVIAEWYKRAERPFTCRLLKAIHTSCECIKSILAMRREMSHLRKDFETGYERLVEVAGKCDIERAKWFRVLPVKPINDFRSATEEFQRIVLMIYSEAKIELDKLTQTTNIDKAGGTKNGIENKDFLFETAQKVRALIKNEVVKKRFQEQVKAFYDDFQEWDEEYFQYSKKTAIRDNESKADHEKRISKIPEPGQGPDELLKIRDHYTDAHILDIVESVFHQEKLERDYSPEEMLRSDYVFLTIVHNNALKGARNFTPINTYIKPEDADWAGPVWQRMTKERSGRKPEFLSSELNNALENVKTDLDQLPPKIEDDIILTEDQVEILNWFNDKFPEIAYVSKYSKRSDKTNRKNATQLESIGFISRPNGKKQGHIITPNGSGYIEKHF